MISCRTCFDKGLPTGCPTCGRYSNVGAKGSQVITEDMLTKCEIPKEYLASNWDEQILKDTHPTLIDDNNFINYIKNITRLVDRFRQGTIPDSSGFIIADRGFGKKTLAYICMKIAMSHGYTVCPMLDNTQIKRINVMSADNNKSYYLYNLPKIEDIIYSDVLFITVDYDNYSTALRTIESIMDKRARLSKSTFVISRYNINEMCMFEKKDKYHSFIEPTGKFNNRKYPVIITYNK